VIPRQTRFVCLSERHPEKQGLKLEAVRTNKSLQDLSERHPEKQGLKPLINIAPLAAPTLSERHPEKQGLKPIDGVSTNILVVFQSAIQKNKD